MKECRACHDDGCFGEQCEICKAWCSVQKRSSSPGSEKKAIVACCFLTKWFMMKSMGPCMEILKSERKPTETGDRSPEERGGMLACDKCNQCWLRNKNCVKITLLTSEKEKTVTSSVCASALSAFRVPLKALWTRVSETCQRGCFFPQEFA